MDWSSPYQPKGIYQNQFRPNRPKSLIREVLNLIRGVMAQAAEAHHEQPRHLSFKGALQTMTAFQDALRRATPRARADLVEAMLEAIASHRVGNRFGRVEPRANKRRPKPQRYLKEPRAEARKQLMQKV